MIFFPLHLGALLSTGQSHGLILNRDSTNITIVPIYDRRLLWPFIQYIDLDENVEGVLEEAHGLLDCLSRLPIDVRATCMKHSIVCGDEAAYRIRQLESIFTDISKSINDHDEKNSLKWINFPTKSIRFFREIAFPPLFLAWTGVSIISSLPHVHIENTRSMMFT